MTGEELLNRLHADLQVSYAVSQSERPGGLTASRLLQCSQAGARALLELPQGNGSDIYRGLRGQWLHDGLSDALALSDPGFTDGRKERFTWDPGGGLPVVTGAYDFLLDGIPVEVKSRPRDECRWHADHGARPEHAAQVAAAAAAVNSREAFVLYVPVDADWYEAAACEVDVPTALRETVHWLHRIDVREEVAELVASGVPRDQAVARVLDPIPREPPVRWCYLFCGWAKDCRGSYSAPAETEILDPTVRAAVQEYESLREQRLALEKREASAKSMLQHAEGRVSEGDVALDLRHPTVPDKPERRGHTKTVVTRRSG